MQPRLITRPAHAKVNLVLRVSPPEPPGSPRAGWHRIASWMHAIDLHDDLTVQQLAPGQPSRCSIDWAPDAPRPSPIDWPLDKDLAVRAHRLLEARTGRPLPASITLTKRIPVGGGLGGGSSDAAATLLALTELFELKIPLTTLAQWSTALGSDIAFFLDEFPPRPALVGGFGDEITRTPRAVSDLTLILPAFGCPTPAVYRAFDSLPPASFDPPANLAAARTARVSPDLCTNDLTPAAASVEPRLTAVIHRAEAALRRPIHMSGSGSTLFALGPPPARLPDIDGCILFPARLV